MVVVLTLVLTLPQTLKLIRLFPRLMVAAQERPPLPIKARTSLGVQWFLILLASSVFLL
jgi:hypothetical protein